MAMFKLMRNTRYGISRPASWSNSWGISKYQIVSAYCSTVTASQRKIDKIEESPRSASETKVKPQEPPKLKIKSPMVTLVFDNLAKDDGNDRTNEIVKATKVEELLVIAQDTNLSRDNAVQIVSTINEWVMKKKIKLKDFEKDPRFAQLCRTFVQKTQPYNKKKVGNKVTAETKVDEDLVNVIDPYLDTTNLTVQRAVKIMNGLAIKRRRIKPILRTLTTFISSHTQDLTIKEQSDVLYSMAVLNFPNDILMQKLCKDIIKNLVKINQSPIIGSIVTSLGIMKYRNSELMNKISEWVVKYKDNLRVQDLHSVVLTFATIGYKPLNSDVFFKELVAPLKETDMIKSSEWLDLVWALTILKEANHDHMSSVLNEKFLSLISENDDISLVRKLKLQNINAVAKLLTPNFNGSLLKPDSAVFNTPIVKTKEKQAFVRSITDALANLFPSRDYFHTNIDNGTGFLLDVEFYFDKKKGPVLLQDLPKYDKAIRIGIVANNYYDYCTGEVSLLGSVFLNYQLLEALNYRILDISHNDFHIDDKLLKRISYINDRIKSIVK